MKILAALLGLFIAGPVWAEDFAYRGQWSAAKPSSPKYVASVLIDADGRVAVDAASENGKPARFFGYVKLADERRMHIVVTNGTQVANTHCVIHTSELMQCHTVRDDKSVSDGVFLTKIGPGPHQLTRAP